MARNDKTAGSGEPVPMDNEALVRKVREKYAEIAAEAPASGCCGPAQDSSERGTLRSPAPESSCCAPAQDSSESGTLRGPAETTSEQLGYSAEDLAALPEGADLGLGCGAPLRHLDLKPGETMLDLGSGAGVDVFIAARRVGPEGRAIGVDMTPEMLTRARNNAKNASIDNVEFREGRLEALPVDDGTIDAVTSNCVINLVPDKSKVFGEVARVLRPGGRLVISDIVLDGELPDAVKNDLLSYVGCVSGAVRREEYFAAVEAAGLSVEAILDDKDVVTLGFEISPGQVESFAGRAGVAVDDLRGKVRSVTFRAVKR